MYNTQPSLIEDISVKASTFKIILKRRLKTNIYTGENLKKIYIKSGYRKDKPLALEARSKIVR